MISSPLLYLFSLAALAAAIAVAEQKSRSKFFRFVPSFVLIYLCSMALASFGLFEQNEAIDVVYKNTKQNLLPAMLFLMLLQVNIRDFFQLGKSLLIAYALALFSLFFAFIVIAIVFDFDKESASAFGALSGSWMGGVANMLAVGSALSVSQEAFGYALIVDSVNYTVWIMFLLFLTPFAHTFNSLTDSQKQSAKLSKIGCACSIGAKRYWLLILLSIVVAFLTNFTASSGFILLNYTTTTVLLATILGVLGSFTNLKSVNGSSEVSMTMLYMLIALIGSKAAFENFEGIGLLIFAGFCILLIHAFIMVAGAKIFRLDLFSIAIASLANIGGVASTSILAATYNKALVGVGVLMAVTGYLVGTFGGLGVGSILVWMAE